MALAPWVRPVAYCEVDRYCQAVLLSRMRDGSIPCAPIWDDVTTFVPELLPRSGIDIVYGGFPCQDISLISPTGEGLEGQRSGLFFEVARLVRETRPSFVFLENVAAIAFRGLDRVTSEFSALGYDCRWDMLRASDVGAFHRRERWWLLAHADCSRLPESRFESHSQSQGHTTPSDSAERGVQGSFWIPDATELRRIPDGIRPASHRVRALGNAVVPQCAREAFRRLAGL
jgi:DNA (cytosine-5)-methyltransferase 1